MGDLVGGLGWLDVFRADADGQALVERPADGCCGPPQTDAEGHPLQALVCEDCRARFAVFD